MTRQPLFFSTAEIAGSPADDAETVVAILHGVTCQFSSDTFKLHGFLNISPDASVSEIDLLIRRDSIGGVVIGVGDSVTIQPGEEAGGFTVTLDVSDTPGDVANQTYVLTCACTGAAGPSNVNVVALNARCD